MAPVRISINATTARRATPQVCLRPKVPLPSSTTRSVRAFGFFDDLKKAASDMASDMTDKIKSKAEEVSEAEEKAAADAGDAAKDTASEVEEAGEKVASEASKAVDAAKDAVEK